MTVLVQTQLRLLLLTTLLLCTTVVLETERGGAGDLSRDTASVFTEPPAYLHPPAVIGFDLSGLSIPATNQTEAALLESTRSVKDALERAHTHLSLAVYYKMRGLARQAAVEKRKADYWRRVARYLSVETPA
jgi:hypothetical protein